MDNTLILNLIHEAKNIADRNFCCKHSGFTVGAALLTGDGKIYTGFNIENDGIQSICAERVVFSKALTDGVKDFRIMAVVGKKMDSAVFVKTLPCGYCRQFLSEYTTSDFMICTYDDLENKIIHYTLGELLPNGFSFEEEENGK